MDPAAVRQMVNELNNAGQHEDVIALIDAALIHGQSQPWMYEVLALTMEVAGRPRAEIERVLLSSRDLIAADMNSLLYLSAYLARFDRWPQALRCCRQAAALEPQRVEPYAEALRLARKAKDSESEAWACLGLLRVAWGPQDEARREEARAAIADLRKSWSEQGRWMELAVLEQAAAEADRVDLRIRLEWAGAGDLDLVILEPQGTVCKTDNKFTAGGGIYIHDGAGPAAQRAYDEYVCPEAWPGEYQVRVEQSWGTIVGKRARLIITRADQSRQIVPVEVSAQGTTVRLNLVDGRRKQAAGPRPTVSAVPRRTSTPTVLAQLAPANTGAVPTGGVGYQPVVQLIGEGVTSSAMAVVSGDRRYVRMSLQPVFSNITDVFTFSFVR